MRCLFLRVLPACSILASALSLGDEPTDMLVQATYKLANVSSTATGTVYCRKTAEGDTQRFLVTAGHVLEAMNGDTFHLVSRTRQEDGTFSRHEIPVAIRREGKPLWKKHAQHDIAVLLLPDSVAVRALPFDCLPTDTQLRQVFAGDDLRLVVFPERSEANAAGFPIVRGGILASYPFVPVKPHPAFLVDTTAWPGDSGGPVSHGSIRSPSGGPLVIGIVRGMRNITDTVKESRFVERRTHYPLGISEVLHALFARELIEENW